jgi:hypothetical protein
VGYRLCAQNWQRWPQAGYFFGKSIGSPEPK